MQLEDKTTDWSRMSGLVCPLCSSDAIRSAFTLERYEQNWILKECRECALRFVDPVPTEACLKTIYAGDYHLGLLQPGQTERWFGEKYRRYVDRLSSFVPEGGRVVDIGCSTGLLVRMLRDAGYDAEGIEINQTVAEWGGENYSVPIHVGTLGSANYEPESLSAVTMTDVLEHMPNPLQFLQYVTTLLQPGGSIFVTFPDISSLESRYWYCLAVLLRRSWLWGNCHVPGHIWEFTKKSARTTFREAGLSVRHYARSQERRPRPDSLPLRVLSLPPRILEHPFVARRWGTQMEFVATKDQN